MTQEARKNTKPYLALAIGQGVSIAAWARANEVTRPTAFRWAKDPLVRKAADSYRRRVIDQAIGRMTKQTTLAADTVISIAKEAASDSVRLRAARSLYLDMITVSKYSGLETRVTEIEDRVAQQISVATSA